jgi:aspartyl-tRNA(Asn)/glutamyl-tRNA(Gln) amidotransferase subunit C
MSGNGNGQSAGQVSREDVMRVAELAQLELTSDETASISKDLNSILGYIAQLSELDTADVPPMAQGAEGANVSAGSTSALRGDALRPSLDRAEVMAEAPESDGTYFKVPKVIER